MNWFRKYPLFAVGLTVCGLVAVGELALIYERFTASREVARRLAQRQQELEGVAQLKPAPTREVATAIEADLAKAQQSLAAMKAELTGKGPTAERFQEAKVPGARTDAFFDLATFVERMREMADKQGIETRAEAARFGFSQYVNEGPEANRIEPVFRQRQLAEYLLGALFEARPRALLSVKRARPITKAERDARAAALASGQSADDVPIESGSDSPDYFEIDPSMSARVAGYVDTTPFRIVFTGQTAALRNFLNRLAAFDLPVLIREVEVDMASAEESLPQAAADGTTASPETETPAAPATSSVVLTTEAAAQDQPAVKPAAPARVTRSPAIAPIVPKSLSKFTVTVEFIELLAPPVAQGEQPESPPPS